MEEYPSNMKELTDEDKFETLIADGVVVVDFSSSQCAPCREIEGSIVKVAQEFPKVKFFKVDVDKFGDLADEYEVLSIPNLVYMANGKEVMRSVGLISAKQITRKVEKCLKRV